MLYLLFIFILFPCTVNAQEANRTFNNPILPGFNPDPSICRVNDNYYMVTSSFVWYPGVPIYHSKDLVNWELIGHAIDRPDMIDMEGISDNDGIWAATIRYHDGLFYLIMTASKSGGNFYLTAKDPTGPWSNPVWLKDAPGIDPSLFWDDDGKCYYIGNKWNFKKSWPAQCAIWMQELDLGKKALTGNPHILTYGHANNATYAEGPHLYKINGNYILLMSEGGTDNYHAVTYHHSSSLWGPYIAGKTNPILSHRHLGKAYPIQGVGHADLVETQKGEWYSVVLGKRMIKGYNPLARETFLCKVDFDGTTPIYNMGYGKVLLQQQCPNLPWTPYCPEKEKDDFTSHKLSSQWHFVRIPHQTFHTINNGELHLALRPEIIDSLTNSAMLLRRIKHHDFMVTTRLSFDSIKPNEQAGIILYRTANGYYSLLKGKAGIWLFKKHLGEKKVVSFVPYKGKEVYLRVTVKGLGIHFSYGQTLKKMQPIGNIQNMEVLADNSYNRFNGSGVGVYVTSNGQKTSNSASYDWFEYKSLSLN